MSDILPILDEREALLQLLDKLGIRVRIYGDEAHAKCPNPNHNDRNPSWSININPNSEKFGNHYCFSCNYRGSWIDNIIRDRITDESLRDEFVKENLVPIKHHLDDPMRKRFRLKQEEVKEEYVRINLPMTAKPIDIETPPPFLEYLLSRGLTAEMISAFKIHYAEKGLYKDSVILPMYKDDELICFLARYIFKSGFMAKRYPEWSRKSAIIYPMVMPELDKRNECFIVEGAFDMLKLRALNFENVYAMNGNRISRIQAKYLRTFKKCTVIPDGDKGGEELVVSAKMMLKGIEIFSTILPEGEDPSSCPENELRVAVMRAKNVYGKTYNIQFSHGFRSNSFDNYMKSKEILL